MIVHTSHGDHVSVLPSGAVNLGYSDRTENEIWHVPDRVFAVQCHPEYSNSYMEEMILNKLYEDGLLNDMTRDEVMERINDSELSLTRSVLNLVIFAFIYT